MISINNFIQEKLKIGANTKIGKYNDIIKQIINFLYCEPDEISKEEYDIILKWVESNNIKNITVLTTEDVLERYGLIDEYNDVSLEDVKNMFESETFKIKIMYESLYKEFSENLGKLQWSDAYEHTKIYIYDYDEKNIDKSCLIYKLRMAGNIFFYPENDPVT